MMKRIQLTGLIAALLVTSTSLSRAGEKKAKGIDLFNGKDLSGWDFYLVDPDVKMEDVWSVQDGLLTCKGKPMGYLCTKEKYESFQLVVEWRWPPGSEPSNSGVLMRITGEPMALPKCIEAQLKGGSAGDMYGFQGRKIDGDATRKKVFTGKKTGEGTGVTKAMGNEKEPGQWNRYEITADGPTITCVVNGKQVNQAINCDVIPGLIGLQSEGGEIQFRTVRLIPLK